MNKKMKLVSVAAAMAMAASMSVSAFAAQAPGTPGGNVGGAVPVQDGTEVWAGVAVDNPDMRIKVTVPTLFAFVVNGSVDAQYDNTAISKDDVGLLLPNVKVENVTGAGGAGDSYDLTTTGSGNLTFDNYSTYYDSTASDYRGLEVELQGSLKNETGSAWEHVTTAPTKTKGVDVKKYQISVNSQPFDTVQEDGTHGMETAMTLDAPANVATDNNLDATTKLAKTPYSEDAEFDVTVGGTRTDYQSAENSAKIGTIVWKVKTNVTIPDNGP